MLSIAKPGQTRLTKFLLRQGLHKPRQNIVYASAELSRLIGVA
jgi:hypothetical protein